MKIERVGCNKITVEDEKKGEFAESYSVEAQLLFEILEQLRQLNSNVIDVETAVQDHSKF
jgi:hypothetical protein